MGWTTLCCLVGIVFLVTPASWIYGLSRFWEQGVHLGARWIAGLRYEIRGLERVPEGSVIIAAKHQSAWETLIFNLYLGHTAFVLKKELLAIPILGWLLWRDGHVSVDRSAGAKALRLMVEEARRVLAAGRRVIIFPQGTRLAPGVKAKYQTGIAALYTRLESSVVPVALNSGWFWPRASFIQRSGVIVMEFLPPIEPGLSRSEFMTRLETAIETASERLLADAQSQGRSVPVDNSVEKPEASN